jgi:hypothetical protein
MILKGSMPYAVGRLYVEQYFDENAKQTVKKLIILQN